jgi:hypothetical protein
VTTTTDRTTETDSNPTTDSNPRTITLPIPPAALSIDFNGPALMEDIGESNSIAESIGRVSTQTKAMRRAVLLDPSFTGRGRTDRISPTRSNLTSAAEFLSSWEAGLIYMQGPMPYTIEGLQFNPNAAGKAFNMIDSRNYVLAGSTVSAIERAINAGWKGETQDAIDRQLAAASERLELLKLTIPRVSEGKAVETYVRDIYHYVAARLDTVQEPLAEALADPLDFTTSIDFGFLSALAGIEPELDKAREITTRWMLKLDDGGIAARLTAMSDQMEAAEKQVLTMAEARAKAIKEFRSQLGK